VALSNERYRACWRTNLAKSSCLSMYSYDLLA